MDIIRFLLFFLKEHIHSFGIPWDAEVSRSIREKSLGFEDDPPWIGQPHIPVHSTPTGSPAR